MILSCDLSHLSRRMWFDRRLVTRLALAAWLAGVRRQITFACERERTYVNSVRWRLSKVDECNSTAIRWMNFDFHGWYVNSVRWRLLKVDECNSTAIHWMNFDFHTGWTLIFTADCPQHVLSTAERLVSFGDIVGVVWRRLELTIGVIWRHLELWVSWGDDVVRQQLIVECRWYRLDDV